MLFGMNSQSALLLAVIGLREVDVERFRDIRADDGGAIIEVYTRTGGGNREAYPNVTMRKRPEWRCSVDDEDDTTYCTDTFDVPEQWRQDVDHLKDILTHGLRPEFAQHLAAALRREPTEADKAQRAQDSEASALRRTRHFMANGHTFVPLDDHALKTALDLAEKNGGKLLSCWGIAPIALTVKRDFHPYPNAKGEADRQHFVRLETGYDCMWAMDAAYWEHMKARFGDSHPLAMGEIAATVANHQKKTA